MKALRPLLLSNLLLGGLLLSACSSEAEKALEKVRQSPNPENCLVAILSVYRGVESEADSQLAQEQLQEIRQIVESFTALEMGQWLILMEEQAEEIEKAQKAISEADWTVPQLYTEKN